MHLVILCIFNPIECLLIFLPVKLVTFKIKVYNAKDGRGLRST